MTTDAGPKDDTGGLGQFNKGSLQPDEVVALITAASLSVLVPHIALLKILLRKGLVEQTELRAIHEKMLSTKAYPPQIASMLEPIWKPFKRELSIDD